MKSVAILLVILALVAVPALAQEHPREKKASGELDISVAVKVSNYTLEPGKYRLACDRHHHSPLGRQEGGCSALQGARAGKEGRGD